MSVLEEYGYRLASPEFHNPDDGSTFIRDTQAHLPFLHETVLAYDKPAVIELGIQAGNSNCALLSAAEKRGGILYSCDLQTRGQLQARLPHDRVEWWDHPSWRVFHGDDLSPEALAWMPEQCDVLFTDSDHSYGHVLATLEAYLPRVKPGGVALFHDTQWEYPSTDLGKPGGEVARALDEYCGKNGLTWENRPGSYGLGMIRA
jgi:predicted O-methyltransferase YrrM